MMDHLGRVGLSEEQADLLEVATNFAREKSPIEQVRSLIDDPRGFDPEVWAEIGALGWLAIAIPEEYDGVGLGLAEVTPVIEQLGRMLLASPFFSTTLAAQAADLWGRGRTKSCMVAEDRREALRPLLL